MHTVVVVGRIVLRGCAATLVPSLIIAINLYATSFMGHAKFEPKITVFFNALALVYWLIIE